MTVDVAALETYGELLAVVEPRPIRSAAEADEAGKLIDALTDLPRLSEGQREFVGLLAQLLHDWERDREQPVVVTPQEVVQTLLEDRGLRQVDLVGPVFPSRSAVSDFLAGRRPLSYERAGKLASFFRVSPAVFYPPTQRV
jgi:HTH-type transcriptional regulator/antitoxin HigA